MAREVNAANAVTGYAPGTNPNQGAFTQAATATPGAAAGGGLTPAAVTPTQATTITDPNVTAQVQGMFEGYRVPFSAGVENGVIQYKDATGKAVPKDVFTRWQSAGSPVQGSAGSSVVTPSGKTYTVPGGSTGYGDGGPNAISGRDTKTAQDTFKETIYKGNDLYDDISAGGPRPAPTSIPKPITAPEVQNPYLGQAKPIDVTEQKKTTVGVVDASGVARAGQFDYKPGQVQAPELSDAARLNAAMQKGTTVAPTDTRRVEQTAEGQGAIAQGLAANLRLAQQRSLQQRQGLANQARGSERRGLRRALLTGAGAEDLATADTIIARTTEQQVKASETLANLDQARNALQAQLTAAQNAADQAAINDITKKMADLDQQRAITRAEMGLRAQETNVANATDAAKFAAAQRLDAEKHIADLGQQRQNLQAQLEAARNAGNAAAANAAAMRMSEIDADLQKTQAALQLDAEKFRSDQAVKIQQWDVDTALKAQGQEFDQWLQTGDLRIKATEVAQKGAQNLLNEDQRQRALAMAQREFDESVRRYNQDRNDRKAAEDKAFWGGIISSILSGGAQVGAMAVGKPPAAAAGGVTEGVTIAGEAGPELVIPIRGRLSDSMRASLAVEKKPFAKGMDASRLASVLAAANLAERKRRAS